ncbi:sigma-70 family RNA polymerase sigma factor [Reichenbachiella versicolor]|uniref:sigma-70 family RNA polymerase sigma factor n=1 Tax=Reichenbachiella versicolor TaxID=1821036 RepID=UPI000D6E048E|nr:sigma-70 family RNA polymerase sigma factor [Reichenbachiella versicolor]
MSQAELTSYRPLLYSIAYKLVGCTATAEDLVQDTFVNWLKTDKFKVKDVKAYLIKSITNSCFNYLNSIKKKKEQLMENVSLPQINFSPDFSSLDLRCEVTQALATMSKKLAPSERAVFMLKGLFNIDYSEITSILNKTSDNCRQLFSRAQTKLVDDKDRFNLDTDHLLNLVTNFKKATLGELTDLIDNLKRDIENK